VAVKRTGIIYSAEKLRSKQSSAPGFFGKIKKPRDAFGWVGFVLEIIGRPFLWFFLSLGYLLLFSLSFISRLVLNLPRQAVKVNLLIKRATKTFIQSLPRPRIPRRPKIRLPKIVLKRPGKKLFLTVSLLLFVILFGLGNYWFVFKDLPHPNRLMTRDQAISTKIYDRHGELLYKIYRSQNRTLMPLSEIPLPVIQATIAIEDAEFYSHRGFSPKGILRAFLQNLKGGKLYGGSTITQQLVKNTLLSSERTLQRKLKEVILALWVETKFTKDEILQMYFSEVGYGGAAYGIEEAAQMYFGKSVKSLTLGEAALIASLPASPTSSSPFGAHPEKAKERQAFVLKRMVQERFIGDEEAETARKQELRFAPQRTDIQAPHFVMYVKELLVQKYGLRQVEEGGLEVTTSLDLNLQEKVQAIVRQEVDQLYHLHITNGAALVTKPTTGEVLAMVGSRDYFGASAFDKNFPGNFNVTTAARQPGSSIKPVMYSVALENGFTPATIIPDTPITYQLPGQPPYSPKNYDNRSHGNVPLRLALASSYNVPAVKVLSALGVERMIKRGQEMGITTWNDSSRFGLSLTLGGGEVKMVDMAVAYGTLANLGTRVDLNPILEVKNYKGKILESAFPSEGMSQDRQRETPNGNRVFSPGIAYILTDILSDKAARTPAFGPNSVLNIPDHPHVAVKTGTTQNLRDNWTIGYTFDYTVLVWVGNNDNTPMSYVASGITGASPIWSKIMSFLIKDVPDKEFPQPEDLKKVEICPLTNTLPCEGCGGKWEYFLPDTEPKNHCDPEKLKEIKEKDFQTPKLPE